jgi:cell division protein FtsW (lipid II flippase)
MLGKIVDFIIPYLVMILILFFGFSGFDLLTNKLSYPFWRNWELAAILFTGLYSIYELIKGIWKKDFLKGQSFFIGAGGVILLIICYLLLYSDLGRTSTLVMLVIATGIICGIDWSYIIAFKREGYSSKSKEDSQKLNFYYCNFPTIIVFGILLAYSSILRDPNEKSAFFAGAVTFQLLISNIVWALNKNY